MTLALKKLCIVLFSFMVVEPAVAQEISGVPRVIDGDTIEIAGQAIRLAGADAPPTGTLCGETGREWRCGEEATFALAYVVAEHWVTCTPHSEDAWGTLVAQCKVGPYDLAERMITDGWALAVGGYESEESFARGEQKGIWRDGYIPPTGWEGAR